MTNTTTVLAVIITLIFSLGSSLYGAGTDKPSFGMLEKQLRQESKRFAKSLGYANFERIDAGNIIFLSYDRNDNETQYNILMFAVSKKTGRYFAISKHDFIRSDQKDTVDCEKVAYANLTDARKLALEKGFVQISKDGNDQSFALGDLVLELGVEFIDGATQFTWEVWSRAHGGGIK
jgi:hypothetical protein